MNKNKLLFIEVIFPVIWISSFVLWKVFVRKVLFIDALKDASAVTIIIYLILNILIYINYDKIFSNNK